MQGAIRNGLWSAQKRLNLMLIQFPERCQTESLRQHWPAIHALRVVINRIKAKKEFAYQARYGRVCGCHSWSPLISSDMQSWFSVTPGGRGLGHSTCFLQSVAGSKSINKIPTSRLGDPACTRLTYNCPWFDSSKVMWLCYNVVPSNRSNSIGVWEVNCTISHGIMIITHACWGQTR